MADEFVAVCIAVFTTLIVSWLFSPLDKLCKSWNYWRCFQNRLPEGVRPFSEIPGPRGLPYFGNVIQHIMNAKSLQLVFAQKQLFERYGPIFKETVMGETHVYLKSPTDLEAVFKAEGKYPKRASDVMTALGKYFKSRNKVVASFGLLDDKEWSRFHKAMAPKLLRPRDVRENLKSLCNMSRDAIKHLVKIRGTGGLENEIPDLEEVLFKFASETMGVVLFDLRVGHFDDPPNSEAAELGKVIKESFTLMGKLNGGLEWFLLKYTDFKTPTFNKFCEALDFIFSISNKYVDKTMTELKEMSDGPEEEFVDNQAISLMSYLLTKRKLQHEEITLGSMILFRGGAEVTATTALWLLYELASNPMVQKKLYEEVSSLADPDGDLTPESFTKMDYMKACVKETLRLYPDPIFWSRVLACDAVLSGYHAPAGTKIRYSNFLAGHSEELFPDPLKFQPERWLNKDKNEIHPYASIPFGLGRRMCTGRRLAETEIYLLAAKIVQRFELEYHGKPVEVTSEFLVVPDRVMRIKFKDRE